MLSKSKPPPLSSLLVVCSGRSPHGLPASIHRARLRQIMSSSKSNFFGRAWNRARGKSDVERICKKVFDDLADKNTLLLDINSLHIATLMVYNSINKQLVGPHKDPPCLKIVTEKMEEYRAKKKGTMAFTEFQEVILNWVEKDLRLVLAKAASSLVYSSCGCSLAASRHRSTAQRKTMSLPNPNFFGRVWNRARGRKWKERQVRKITDKEFGRLTEDAQKREEEALTFEEVYIAVLIIYNDINKYLPGPHHDPPSKEKLEAMMDEYDVNLDGLLDREEFAEFIRKMTADSLFHSTCSHCFAAK